MGGGAGNPERVALAAYDVPVARVTRLPRGFNTTFRVDGTDGRRYVLRVQRPDGPTERMVRSEMEWLAALRADTGLVVPEPVPTRDGDLLTTAGDPPLPCVLYRWVEGRFLDRGLTPAHLRRVGAFTARLHAHGARFRPAGFHRGRTDIAGLAPTGAGGLSPELGERTAALVGRLHSAAGADVVRAVIARVLRTEDALGWDQDAFGLIHADLHQENYLFHRGEVRAIDFDDCGHGHYAYDLAVTTSELDRPELHEAFLDGYRAERPLPPEEAVEDFRALRRLQLMVWAARNREHPMFRDTWYRDLDRGLRRLEATT